MNKFTIGNLTRVSKGIARKLWGQNKILSLCPVKLRPDGPWRPNIDVFPEEQKEKEFDKFVNEFEWYNCQLNETGYYTAFYIRG
jgi:hypothetical protein